MVRSNPVGTAIGGAALAALLLAGCGTDDDGAAASPSSAAPSASASTATPDPDATPDDYVPASLDGPAKNVPKPVMPALAKEESREGAQAFLDYWSDAKWYAYETGDASLVRDVTSRHCEACKAEFKDVEALYAEGFWTVGGRDSITIQDANLVEANDGIYKPVVEYSRKPGQLVKHGKVVKNAVGEPSDPSLVYLDFADEEWVYITLAPIPGSS
ncbi:hypothetical protein AVL61_13045 [Kocuria rosea subsp. polaris]|uniref:DUF6318 domain-containing protein n=1 Tax=Kocuria rosea subsp. polaris TaxID=136273 RepID=A0A0W8IMT9_KOCRO|nr:DUF6318 family protein [Kocuria polaris]KUG61326.1 hypothetical protein AVL61_13045 [Kocuria polaris]